MKKMFLFWVLMLMVWAVSAQVDEDWLKRYLYKGKDVTYEVYLDGFFWLHYRNVNNPDTTACEMPDRLLIPPQIIDISAQVAEITREHLTAEELASDYLWGFIMILRVDREQYKILEVIELNIAVESMFAGWSADRLHALEKDIVQRVVLPKYLQETFLTDDFAVSVCAMDVVDVDVLRERRRRAMEEAKAGGPLVPIKESRENVQEHSVEEQLLFAYHFFEKEHWEKKKAAANAVLSRMEKVEK